MGIRLARGLIAGLAVLMGVPAAALAQAGDPGSLAPGAPASKPSRPGAGAAPGGKSADSPGASDRVDLRPRFRVGESMRYVMQIDSRNRLAPVTPSRDPAQDADVSMDQGQSQRIGLKIDVTAAGEDGASLKVVFESIRLVMDMPGGKAVFDSTSPSGGAGAGGAGSGAKAGVDKDMSELLGKLMGPMVGTTLDVRTDASGAITSVSGGDALTGAGAFAELLKGLTQGLGAGGAAGAGMPAIPGLPAGLPGLGSTPGLSPGGNWLTGSSGGPGLRRVGESWTFTDNLGATPAGPLMMVTTHTLRSHAGGVATVTFRGQAAGNASPGSSGGGGGGGGGGGAGTPRAAAQDARYSGQFQWDTRAGGLRELTSEMTSTSTGTVGDRPVRMSAQTNISVRRQ
jgi:hypothetical protein